MKRRMAMPRRLIFAASLCAAAQSAPFAVAEEPAAAEPAVTEQPVLQRHAARKTTTAGRQDTARQLQKQTSAFDMLWPLCIVLGIVVLCVLAVRKWMPQAGRLGGSDAIRLLGRHHLSGKQSLCLVKFGPRAVLLGVTNERISALSEVADPEEVASLVAAAERGRPGSFTSMFSKFTGTEAAGQSDTAHETNDIEAEMFASSESLKQTGQDIRGLVQRVRTLSSRNLASTEST